MVIQYLTPGNDPTKDTLGPCSWSASGAAYVPLLGMRTVSERCVDPDLLDPS
jgi:hypothetical protein